VSEWNREVRARLDGLDLPPAREAEIVDELAAHLDDRYRALIASGVDERAARRQALEELASADALRSRLAAVELAPLSVDPPGRPVQGFAASVVQDVRYAWRTLARQPGVAAIAILMLSLCTGANTAMYSVVHAVLFTSPYRDPAHIVMLTDTHDPARTGMLNAAPDEVDGLHRLTAVFQHVAAFSLGRPIMTGQGDPRRVAVECVSADMFGVLGIAPIAGRAFSTDDDRQGAAPVMVVSAGFWRQELGGHPDAIGRDVTLDGNAVTVIGVFPDDFDGVRSMGRTEAWVPIRARIGDASPAGCFGAGGNVYARLDPALSVPAADARLAVLTNGTRGVISLNESTVGDDRPMLLMLFGAVGFVLLIGCANVANLLLGRAIGRRREMATRLALGASAGRVMRQLLSESVFLCVIGAFGGLLVSRLSLASIVRLMPIGIPGLHRVTIDGGVLAFSIAAGVGVGLAAGLVPALQFRSARLAGWLHDVRAATERARSWPRRALVIFEVALSVALVIGAALTVRTFYTLRPLNPGFDPSNKLVVEMQLTGPSYRDRTARRAFASELLARLRAVPGVDEVSLVNFVPFAGLEAAVPIGTADHPAPTNGRGLISTLTITSNYLAAMKIPLVAGRAFDETDEAGAPGVAIVNEEMARRLWPDRSPIGEEITIHSSAFDAQPKRVVGVAGNVRTFGNTLRPSPQVYVPYVQEPSSYLSAVVRVNAASVAMATVLKHEAANLNPTQVVGSVTPLDQVLAEAGRYRQFVMSLMTSLSLLALSLATIGLAAVIGSAVAERTKEIGIRMTLGASPAKVARLIVGQAISLAGAGIAIGLGLAAATTRFLADLLYGVKPLDAGTFAAGAAIMLVVSIAASAIPARRAARVDPLMALRRE